MPCANPRKVYRPTNGGPIQFTPPKDGRGYNLTIPCGVCILCRQEYARQTAVRITHEATLWEENAFITLTYNDKNIPEHNSLQYEDLVKFWKRLRKRYGKLRYYAVGEYGDKTQRPHYHAVIFGLSWAEDRVILRTTPSMLWTHPALEAAWGLGNVSVGAVTFETARYTASYVTKKLRLKQRYVRVNEETGELLDLQQPRAFMSRNIAKEWWQKWHQGVIDHDRVIIDGHIQKPPKAYDKWLLAKDKPVHEKMKEKRRKLAKPQTREEARARAENAHARVKNKNKSV